MSKPVYGGRDAVEVDRVEDAVDMMVKAQDETEYDWGLRYMSYLLDGVDEKTFSFTFRRTSDACLPS
ncbi:hypothetical protein GQ600_22566 [Phytophthora cactorum]|nr:hypothetical protein GQ600_24231 [Phytophthora cactorum]KAF1779448.1 hypothetical protein GQ600_22566 [Phytophthora cactorum]